MLAIASACSRERQARTTSCPRSSSMRVNAVPHEPAPATKNLTSRSFHEVDRDRHAVEAEALAQPVLDPVAVVPRDEPRVVDEHAEARRTHPDLGAVKEVEPAAARAARRLSRLAQLRERAVQLGGRDPRGVTVEELGYAVEQPLEAASGMRRHRDEWWPLPQPSAQLPANLLDVDRRHVPLREDDEGRAIGVARDVGDRDVLLHDAFGGIDEDERHVGPLRSFEGAQLRVELDPLPVPPLAPQAGGVDQDEGPLAALEHRVDGVARGAGDLAHDQALPAEKRVDEARLPDVRPPEDRDADRVVRQGGASSRREALELVDDAVEQVAAAGAVQAGDRDRIAEAQPVQLEGERLLARIVDL